MVKRHQVAGLLLCAFILGVLGKPMYAFAQVSSEDSPGMSSCTTSLPAVSGMLTEENTSIKPINTAVLTSPQQLAGIATNPSPTDVSQAFATPTPTPLPEAIIQPETIAVTDTPVSETSLNADLIFSIINTDRRQAGLPQLIKTDTVCQTAATRASEIYNEIMVTGDMHAGFYAMHLPYRATENLIFMRSEQEAVNWWLSSPIHRAAIYGNYKYSCIACSGEACSEIFADY